MRAVTATVVKRGMQCRQCHVRRRCILRPVAEWGRSAHGLEHVYQLERQSHLYSQHDPPDALFIIRSGSAKTYVSGKGKREQVINFSLPGDLIGLAALAEERYQNSAAALELSTVCRIPIDLIEKFGRRDSMVYRELLRYASREIQRGDTRLQRLFQFGAEERLAAFVLCVSGCFSQRGLSAEEFCLPMSRQEIGSYLQLTEETVCRVLRNFQRTGIIDLDRRFVHIRSKDKLRLISGARIVADA